MKILHKSPENTSNPRLSCREGLSMNANHHRTEHIYKTLWHHSSLVKTLILLLPFALLAFISGCSSSNAAAGAVASPGTIDVWPSDMVAVRNDQNARQQPTLISSNVPSSTGPTNVAYYAILSLPVGNQISNVEYYYQGTSSAAFTGFQLWRARLGEADELLFTTSDSGDTSGLIKTVNVPASVATPVMVESGYRYFIIVTTENAESYVRGARIQYQP
jgi:hypothetical protein